MTQPHEAAGALNDALYDGDYDPDERAALIGAHRAEVLREIADLQEATAATDAIRRRRSIATARRLFAVELRRMADEAQPDDTVHACPGRWGGPDCRCFDAEAQPARAPIADQPCPGFPKACPNLRTVPIVPPHQHGGIRCGCGDQPVAEAPVIGLTVESFARMLAGADALAGRGQPFDQLSAVDRERYRSTARTLLDRSGCGDQSAVPPA